MYPLIDLKYFYPRPPRGGRRLAVIFLEQLGQISIHALREEGDCKGHQGPARWFISIHALREEGDLLLAVLLQRQKYFYPRPPRGGRQENPAAEPSQKQFLSTPSARRATPTSPSRASMPGYFYPRPPRGGRHKHALVIKLLKIFLSTPSARRATVGLGVRTPRIVISIHALREEGDGSRPAPSAPHSHFYPRPPRGGRRETQK